MAVPSSISSEPGSLSQRKCRAAPKVSQSPNCSPFDNLADIVREFLPDAQITFENETGGRERSGNFMIDNSRVVTEFGMQFRPYRERVLQIINEVRAEEGKSPITDG